MKKLYVIMIITIILLLVGCAGNLEPVSQPEVPVLENTNAPTDNQTVLNTEIPTVMPVSTPELTESATEFATSTTAPTPTSTPTLTPTPTPTTTPTPTPTPTLSPIIVNVGDTIIFGSYEQDNNSSNGNEEIEWIVLSIEGNKALLLSKYALDCQPYNIKWLETTWENCILRTWLNNEFYNIAFSSHEKGKIENTYLINPDNMHYGTIGGNNTTDKVFLLSLSDINYTEFGDSGVGISNDPMLKCQGTEYAKKKGLRINTVNGNCSCDWWLRSPGGSEERAAFVLSTGDVAFMGTDTSSNLGVRPALWINFE